MYNEFILPIARSRRSIQLPVGDWYIDLKSTEMAADSNYFAIMAVNDKLRIAFGGFHIETTPEDDPLPVEYNDFMTIYKNGHYEAQGSLFRSNMRVWVNAPSGALIVY